MYASLCHCDNNAFVCNFMNFILHKRFLMAAHFPTFEDNLNLTQTALSDSVSSYSNYSLPNLPNHLFILSTDSVELFHSIQLQ